MKQLFAVALVLGLCGPAQAQTQAQPQTQTQTGRTLTMSGQGAVAAAPDRVEIAAGVTTLAPTAAAALAANTQRMSAVFAALAKLGVASNNIRTQNFSVSPQYAEGGGTQSLTGYAVNNEVHVALDDPARLGTALDALVTAGANQMNGLSYSIRDTAALLTRARALAVADARAKAQDYATAAGITLGPILSVSENGEGAPVPMFKAMAARAPVPVAGGEQSVSATVTMVWEIR